MKSYYILTFIILYLSINILGYNSNNNCPNNNNKEWLKAAKYAQNGDMNNALQNLLIIYEVFPLCEQVLFNLALTEVRLSLYNEAEIHIRKAIEILPKADSYNNLAALLKLRGESVESHNMLLKALEIDSSHDMAYRNLGLSYLYFSEYEKALDIFQDIVLNDPNDSDGFYHIGILYEHMNQLDNAYQAYGESIQLNDDHITSKLNLASLLQRKGRIIQKKNMNNEDISNIERDDAIKASIKLYESALISCNKARNSGKICDNDIEWKIYLNCASASSLLGNFNQTMIYFNKALKINKKDTLPPFFQAMKSFSYWKDWNIIYYSLIKNISSISLYDLELNKKNNIISSFLYPFDALTMPLSKESRYKLSIYHANNELKNITKLKSYEYQKNSNIKVGYFSYDFNDHPTTHLIEGLFYYQNYYKNELNPIYNKTNLINNYNNNNNEQNNKKKLFSYDLNIFNCISNILNNNNNINKNNNEIIINDMKKKNIEYSLLSIGYDDNSAWRKSLELMFQKRFIDLNKYSVLEASEKIKNENYDIIIDLQSFTLGGEPEILNNINQKPPIIALYLIYPTTSGTLYTDYYIGDKYMISPENSKYFTESLILLPNTYQVNFFPQFKDKINKYLKNTSNDLLRSKRKGKKKTISLFNNENKNINELKLEYGIPKKYLNSIIFCNFNKQDKLEPNIFHSWMNILNRVDNSILWLLEPSSSLNSISFKNNILLEASSYGINIDRIIFAPRIEKSLHIKRLYIADLFLDTFYYGAHTTLTDSLRGGLPILTMIGDSVASKVSQSLLSSINNNFNLLFTTYSFHDYENMAVNLVTNDYDILNKIKNDLKNNLKNNINIYPLFNTKKFTKSFQDMIYIIWEIYNSIQSTDYNIILTEKIKE